MLVAAALAVVFFGGRRHVVLTGIVTTDDVIVSAEIPGRIERLNVREGDAVRQGQSLALIQPAELRADAAYYQNSRLQSQAQADQAQADLRYQEVEEREQVRQAEANLSVAQAQAAEAKADLEIARLTSGRQDELYAKGTTSAQDHDQARANFEAAEARWNATLKQEAAAEAALALARSGTEQTAARRAALDANKSQAAAAAAAADKAEVRLGYTDVKSPINGIVDVRAALQGEVVNPGQAIVTLINPDDLWVRADVEESYIDRIHLGDTFTVRLPSGAERPGKVYFRGVDADYATQRDVSRSKRDIKTVELRLRCDNADRSLAVGMTAYVLLPF